MPETFDDLFEKAMAAAGGSDYDFPRFYKLQLQESQVYFLALEQNKTNSNFKGYQVVWDQYRRVPAPATASTMQRPRVGEVVGYKPIQPDALPPGVRHRFEKKFPLREKAPAASPMHLRDKILASSSIKPEYAPRFVSRDQLIELVNFWHLAQTALSGQGTSRHTRLIWASDEFHKLHPEISAMAAYKDLSNSLE
jgi:hypothetical protein